MRRGSLHGMHKSTFQINGVLGGETMLPPLGNALPPQQPQQSQQMQGGALDLETRQKLASIQLNKKKNNNIRFY